MFKHIIWDFDGTLFDSYPVMAGLFKTQLLTIGFDEPIEAIMTQMQVSMSHALDFYKDKYAITEEFIASYNKLRHSEEPKHCLPFPAILKLCREVTSNGKFNYLYTHRDFSAKVMLEKYGLISDFTDFITCEDGFERKPSPNAILHLVSKYNMNPEETLMIGDRELDILAAKNAGIRACFYNKNGVECIHADIHIQDFEELFLII